MLEWARQIRSGNVRALARAASAVENRTPKADALLRELFPHTGNALVIGITGPPGAGKSTLADGIIHLLRRAEQRVGVIAVDPTSPYSGGAILGDRIRMQSHYADSGVFIRSMATRGHLGGLAPATTDMALLFDAAGMDVVIVETVGVGQDEVDIVRLADVTAVVLVPGMGDDVQAIKAGIMEIAGVFLINKADQPGADRLEREIHAMLSLAHHDDPAPPVVHVVASEGAGIAEALDAIRSVAGNRAGNQRSEHIWRRRLLEMYRERLLNRIPAAELDIAARDVALRRKDPYSIVDEWLQRI